MVDEQTLNTLENAGHSVNKTGKCKTPICCNHNCNEGRDCPLRQTPVYDAEFFEPSAKHPRGLGLGLHIALLFVLLTTLLVAVIGYLTIN